MEVHPMIDTYILALAARARRKHPELASRVGDALRLIEQARMQRQPDGSWTVPSQRGKEIYHVNGACECRDYRNAFAADTSVTTFAPNGWCKHRLAATTVDWAEHLEERHANEQALADDAIAQAQERVARALAELNAAIAHKQALTRRHADDLGLTTQAPAP